MTIKYKPCNYCGAQLVAHQADLVNMGVEGFECPKKPKARVRDEHPRWGNRVVGGPVVELAQDPVRLENALAGLQQITVTMNRAAASSEQAAQSFAEMAKRIQKGNRA